MARIEDYKEAFRLAAAKLGKVNAHRIAGHAGADIAVQEEGGAVELRLDFLGDPILVRIGEDVDVIREGSAEEMPLPEKILICHYLLNTSSDPPAGELITFRQIPDGRFYDDAFQRRVRNPFLATFGSYLELFFKCAAALGGTPTDIGDAAMIFRVLPRISIQVVLWAGDEEFPPEASVLFDAGISRLMPVEDVVVLSSMLIYRLMGIARGLKQQEQAEGK